MVKEIACLTQVIHIISQCLASDINIPGTARKNLSWASTAASLEDELYREIEPTTLTVSSKQMAVNR
ncbi:hypothetical protein GLOTRDRAFT_127186 [Gloeophyllum trabeum ATCC 11539]|uniref:Uncharacterized protein n=1 Tax=Gloeophyllum trabeum (strain ATCC 11539 / FP-39264 / Madison 617) TaxID=670483 RepID=S7QFQ6_GLOTA|nr:uncharacterized protein GLOTRDRAFT_127186 [Gloeophyllum trabeum ATCC 11539]EPQ58696.1 hypothetical protein GLOTRDRAFT_127186 [Gloeophyllum trabeum ATCC 11539]